MVLTPSSCIGWFQTSSAVTLATCLFLSFSNISNFHRLPVPRPGQVLGLVGTNGIGKSTALKVLAGKLKPNLGRFNVTSLAIPPP